jgi:hypothetical protein
MLQQSSTCHAIVAWMDCWTPSDMVPGTQADQCTRIYVMSQQTIYQLKCLA